MAGKYEIDYEPGNILPAVSMLVGAIHGKRSQDIAEQNAKTQADYAKKNLERESAREARDKQTYELGLRDRRRKAVESANELRRQGRHGEADMLLKLEGIGAAPVIGAPTTTPTEVVTPMSAAAKLAPPEPEPGQPGSPFEGPLEPKNAYFATPMSAAAATMPPPPEHGMGVTVPEEPPAMAPVEPPTITQEPPAPSAERDLLPVTFGGETVPGKPTGAYNYTGPGGEALGTFNPAEEEAFRKEKAGRVSKALGPLGDKLSLIANAVTMGDITQQEANVFLKSLQAEQTSTEKAKEAQTKRDFTREENAKYRNEAMTVQDRKDIAAMMARAKMAAAGAGPVAPGISELVQMKEAGATDAEIYDRAAQLHLSEKQVTAPIQNVVKNAAAGTRAQEKYAGSEVTDETGKLIGHAHSAQQANALKKQIDQFAQAKVRLSELISDIKSTGARVLSPDELQNRLSKAQSVAAAMRVYNGLGATDASQKLESDIMGAIGTPGHGWLLGANLGVVERILHEAEMQHQVRLNTAMRSGGGQPLPPALGGSRRGTQENAHPSQAPVGETRTGPDGRTYRKVGPNNWQPVAQ